MTPPTVLIMALIATTIAPPAPSPDPASGPLKEIGHVRASAACGNIVVHANSAISSTLRNDATLALTVNRLRNLDLQSSTMDLERGIHELDRYAAELRDDAVHGNGEIKRLRELADKSTDPKRKEDLKAFADALGGALYRQKKVAADLGGLIAYLQYREMATPDEAQAKFAATETNDVVVQVATPSPSYQSINRSSESLNELTTTAADDFAGRMRDIAADEVKASDHAEGAVSGC